MSIVAKLANAAMAAVLPVPVSLAGAGASRTGAKTGTIDPKLAAAATKFEAIFIRQMLAEGRKAAPGNDLFSDGGSGTSPAQGLDTFRDMQDARFADTAAARDMLGIAHMLEARLGKAAGSPTGIAGPTGISTP